MSHWIGQLPTKCDLCKEPLTEGFYDGKTIFGPWAVMCLLCHRDAGVGIGEGRGQRYDKEGRRIVG